MKIQKQPNNWSCLPTAFAIALGHPVDHVIAALGHDGSEIIDDTFDEPYCRRAFHIAELTVYAFQHGYGVIAFDKNLIYMVQDKIFNGASNLPIAELMNGNIGVIHGFFRGKPHATAWDGSLVYDPNGIIYLMHDEINIETFFMVKEFK